MRCPTCGCRVPDNARYCSNCATAMERCHDDERDPADFGCCHADDRGPDQTPPPRRTYRSTVQSSGAGKLFGLVFTVIFVIIFLFAASMIINTGRQINRGFELFDNVFEVVEEQIIELEPESDGASPRYKGKR